jgi:hypothetical protein
MLAHQQLQKREGRKDHAVTPQQVERIREICGTETLSRRPISTPETPSAASKIACARRP